MSEVQQVHSFAAMTNYSFSASNSMKIINISLYLRKCKDPSYQIHSEEIQNN